MLWQDDAYSMSPDPSRPVEAFLELDQEACALWYLRDQIASNGRPQGGGAGRSTLYWALASRLVSGGQSLVPPQLLAAA